MDKFKTYIKYALALVGVFILVSIVSKLLIISMYKPKECRILFENPKIEIIDSLNNNSSKEIIEIIKSIFGDKVTCINRN